MEQTGSGRTAEVYRLDGNRILKLFRQGFPASSAQEEYRISRYVHRQGVRTPKAYEVTERDGRTGIVFEEIRGGTMLARMGEHPQDAEAGARRMGELHAEIHSVEAENLARGQKAVLDHQIRHAPYLTEEEKRQLTDRLRLLPDAGRLCHGDFHPDNILYDGTYWIIDWMTGMSGNPDGDVARTALLFSFGSLPEDMTPEEQALMTAGRARLKKAYLEQYFNTTGKSWSDVEPWLLPVAAARLAEGIPDSEKQQLVSLIRARLCQTADFPLPE